MPLSRLEHAQRRYPAASQAECVRAIAGGLIRDLEVAEPPVDVHHLASLLGIAGIIEVDGLPVAGCLLCMPGGRFEIKVRAGDPPGRQRFTACHECAHTFFPGFAARPQFRCAPDSTAATGSRGIEALCDLAASELLLPSALFTGVVSAGPFSFDGLSCVADGFQASLEATGRRFVDAWPEPAALLSFSLHQKPSERLTAAPPLLRLDYAATQGEWPFFYRHKATTPGDAFDRAAGGEVVAETTTIAGICAEPVVAEVHARRCPFNDGGAVVDRVLVLARRNRRTNR